MTKSIALPIWRFWK